MGACDRDGNRQDGGNLPDQFLGEIQKEAAELLCPSDNRLHIVLTSIKRHGIGSKIKNEVVRCDVRIDFIERGIHPRCQGERPCIFGAIPL